MSIFQPDLEFLPLVNNSVTLQSLPMLLNRLGNDRKFGRKFGSALFFVRNYSIYSLSESSAEVRPNRKFGLSLLIDALYLKLVNVLN